MQVNTVQCVDFGCRDMVQYISDYHDDTYASAFMPGSLCSTFYFQF